MRKTIKFTVSMPEDIFKRLESQRLDTGKTRSQFIRDILQYYGVETEIPTGVGEDAAEYKKETFASFNEPQERRKRALDAAGRFRSDLADLSDNHDRYLEGSYKGRGKEKRVKKRKSSP